jgi:iron only hydrogenase large subunit-like protein
MKKRGSSLNFPLKGKYLIMVAPSFVVDFGYPGIIFKLKKLGFDKIVEVTFGAKMVNREYHEILGNSKEFKISSACPGVVDYIKRVFPEYKNNLIKVDSPMIAMGKICRKVYPRHKIVFLSPCNFKKMEASKSKFVDYVIDFKELVEILEKNKIKGSKEKAHFDKFYNDYTKIYPLSGGLTKTAHLKGLIKKKEVKIIDGILKVKKFLENPDSKIKFLDCTFCNGGCIGGPSVSSKKSLKERKERVLDYLEISKREDIPDYKKGVIKRAEGINFRKKRF